MHHDDLFGSKPSPSLAEAMGHTPQLGQQWIYSSGCSTPNVIPQNGNKAIVCSSSQQIIEPILRCSPNFSDPAYNSQPQPILSVLNNKCLDEIENKLCKQIDEKLRMNYKKMKSRIKKMKSRVNKTDTSIHRIQELIESVYEEMDEFDTIPNFTNNDALYANENHLSESKSQKITWRKINHNNQA